MTCLILRRQVKKHIENIKHLDKKLPEGDIGVAV